MKGPSAEQFRKGALLASIAHAIWIVSDATLAYERQWVDGTYCVNNSGGLTGAVYMEAKALVGAVFDESSPRNPLRGEIPADPDRYLTTIPRELRPIMMQHVIALLPSDANPSVRLVTAAFWQVGATLEADESWEQVLEHGGRVFRLELLDEQDAFKEVQNEFQFNEDTMNVVRSIYQERLRNGAAAVRLRASTWEAITRLGHDGINACRNMLASIGIHAPS